MSEIKPKKLKIAWGITGAGDKIQEIFETMKELKTQCQDQVEFDVYISKKW
jgi:flavoprotein